MAKLTGMMIAAKIPNARIGRISERAFDKNAIAVVLDVTAMALYDRRKANAMRRCLSFAISGMWVD